MFKVKYEDIYFESAKEAQDYAKKNLGSVIVCSDKLFNSENEHSQSVLRQLLRLIEGSKLKISNKDLLKIFHPKSQDNFQFFLIPLTLCHLL